MRHYTKHYLVKQNKLTDFDYNNEIIGVDQEDDEAKLNETIVDETGKLARSTNVNDQSR